MRLPRMNEHQRTLDAWWPWLREWTTARLMSELARVDSAPNIHSTTYRDTLRAYLQARGHTSASALEVIDSMDPGWPDWEQRQ
jgi:hypothetical protein